MYGKELRNYLEELSHFRRIIEQIKGELLYAGLPLSEIFYNIASREKEPYENWLMDLAFQCQGTQEKRFADLWTDTASVQYFWFALNFNTIPSFR